MSNRGKQIVQEPGQSFQAAVYRVLIVEDNPDHMEIMRSSFSRQTKYRLEFAATVAEAFDKLKQRQYEAVVADYQLPDGRGTDLIEWVPGSPMIIMTSQGNEEVAVDALKRGAYDYIVKNAMLPDLIVDAVNRACARFQANKETELFDSHARKQPASPDDSISAVEQNLQTMNAQISTQISKPLEQVRGYLEMLTDELGGPLTCRQRECLDAADMLCQGMQDALADFSQPSETASQIDINKQRGDAPESHRDVNAESVPEEDTPLKVLIVDDETSILAMIKRVLITSGMTVDIQMATEGDSAWKAISVFEPDVLILDVNIEHIDGGEILRRIKTDDRLRKTKVIMMSGVPEVLQNMIESGADVCLQKPFDIKKMLQAVQSGRRE